jgi:hypothetical protein
MNLELIYYLLASRYGNSTIASSDENRFKWQLCATIFQYGPTWAQELEIQKTIRDANIETFREGNRQIVNQAENPSTTPSTLDTEELNYVNNQNVSKTKRSLADAAALKLSLLKTDVTEEFLNKFKNLFLNIVMPEKPLWYITYDPEATEDILETADGATLTANYRNRYFTEVFPLFSDFQSFWNNTPFKEAI